MAYVMYLKEKKEKVLWLWISLIIYGTGNLIFLPSFMEGLGEQRNLFNGWNQMVPIITGAGLISTAWCLYGFEGLGKWKEKGQVFTREGSV